MDYRLPTRNDIGQECEFSDDWDFTCCRKGVFDECRDQVTKSPFMDEWGEAILLIAHGNVPFDDELVWGDFYEQRHEFRHQGIVLRVEFLGLGNFNSKFFQSFEFVLYGL